MRISLSLPPPFCTYHLLGYNSFHSQSWGLFLKYRIK
ncbi:unnamed protein product [Spirodela intermedia]|uniref:Uncharacterized protein n=1 Tax=Spirodela intermedia TaxID=51605 RepID=A0A7I8J1E0_SPIIN|nr:unnamed protein product [Spirodela intermedia]CAA6663130.1 unnamed protein product [Spirodela intermedia]